MCLTVWKLDVFKAWHGKIQAARQLFEYLSLSIMGRRGGKYQEARQRSSDSSEENNKEEAAGAGGRLNE